MNHREQPSSVIPRDPSWWRRVVRAVRLGASAILCACSGDCTSDPNLISNLSLYPSSSASAPLVTPVAVRVVPEVVFVGGGDPAQFALRALIEDASGKLTEPAYGTVSWTLTSPPALATVNGLGMMGAVNVVTKFAADFGVVATVGGVSGNATVKPDLAVTGDVVVSEDHPLALPPIAVASGWLPTNVCAGDAGRDEPVAYVRTGRLEALQPLSAGLPPGPCRLDGVVFTPSKAVWRQSMAWTMGSDVLHAVSGMTPVTDQQAITMPARLVIGLTDSYCPASGNECYSLADVREGARNVIDEGEALANDIFANSRVGVRVEIPAPVATDIAPLPGLKDCKDVPLNGVNAPRAGELTIYVVDELVSLWRGVTCHEIGSPGMESNKKVILIGYRDAWLASTLAHELTHALGHRAPRHVGGNITTGFGDHNLMAEVYTRDAKRFYLTLGQVYRMVVDKRSWLNQSGLRTGPTEECQCELNQSAPCPRLALDVKPLERPAAWQGAATCS